MKKTVFTGSGVALITPFKNGEVDFESLGELLQYHIDNSTDAIIVCGTTGESATMPDKEHLSVIEYAVKHVHGAVPVIAGAGSNDTKHGIELTKEAAHLGADAVLLVTPYYNKATQKGLIKHYTDTASAVDIPCILYNVPSRTGTDIKPSTVKVLSEVDNIVAIKEATGDIARAIQIRALCGDNMDIYSGNDDITVPILSAGGKGVISVVANIAPKETHDMVHLYLNGEREKALDIQVKMLDLINALFCEVNPIPVKTAMNLLGFKAGDLRMPLCEMEENTLAILKKALTDYGFELKK